MTTLEHLIEALSLAKKAERKNIKGNPFVGAIVVDENNCILGRGYHKMWGDKHAEVYAIEEALAHTKDLTNCTLYVTLEPCSHQGKTPPCTDLIIQSGIKKVFVGSLDPNPKVSGFQLLKEKGIDIELIELKDATKLNKVFFTNQKKERPFTRLKIAATIAGKMADYDAHSKWITNSMSRAYVHSNIRTEVDAILSTAKTVIKDKATLNIRIENTPSKEVNAVIIDRTGSILKMQHANLPIFYPRTHTKVYIVTAPNIIASTTPLPNNIEIIETTFNSNKEIDTNILGKQLLEKGLYCILVEAGEIFSGYLLSKNWVDELDYFIGSKIALDNEALAAYKLSKNKVLSQELPLTLLSSTTFNNDIYLHYTINES
ncbi:MAG: bifunctional diaminohydroxyphosphoribosylaminopyrimidine deaminase/5-amino-6-(5-phosphoribosylamino)uracil reductase RibD [Sediminibacterium sp.]